jgi:hypothetical protein
MPTAKIRNVSLVAELNLGLRAPALFGRAGLRAGPSGSACAFLRRVGREASATGTPLR